MKKGSLDTPPSGTEGSGDGRPIALQKQDQGFSTPGCPGGRPLGGWNLRSKTAWVRDCLVGVETNPGPNGRSERRRVRRREWRRARRMRRREREEEKGRVIVTWNLQ